MATLNVKTFPDDLYELLKQHAEVEHRSIAQQVVHMLEAALRKPRPRRLSELQGLGQKVWEGIDVAAYIDEERNSWDS